MADRTTRDRPGRHSGTSSMSNDEKARGLGSWKRGDSLLARRLHQRSPTRRGWNVLIVALAFVGGPIAFGIGDTIDAGWVIRSAVTMVIGWVFLLLAYIGLPDVVVAREDASEREIDRPVVPFGTGPAASSEVAVYGGIAVLSVVALIIQTALA